MPRSLRLEHADAVYHVTSRGVQRAPIFVDDHDRKLLLKLVGRTLTAYRARVLAYCLMGNHYHLVVHTRLPNLSALMQRLNSSYSQQFNHRHSRLGQVFGGRFKTFHVDRDEYLLAVCRYVDLNPVRAGLVCDPGEWDWSSYQAHTGLAPVPEWLATEALHDLLAGQPARKDAQVRMARRSYADWVAVGRGVRLWEESLRHGLYVGGDAFIERTIAASGQGDS